MTNPDGTEQTTEAGFLGVRTTAPVEDAAAGHAVPGIIGTYVSRTAEAIVHIPARMVVAREAAFGGAEREIDSPMSVVGARPVWRATEGKYDAFVGTRWATRSGSSSACSRR